MGKKAECERKGEGIIRVRLVGQKEVSTEAMRERRGGEEGGETQTFQLGI